MLSWTSPRLKMKIQAQSKAGWVGLAKPCDHEHFSNETYAQPIKLQQSLL